MDKYEKFAELLEDPVKAEEIMSDSIEETQANLKANGLDFSIEELEEIAVQAVKRSESGELSEDSLDDVSGGITRIVPHIAKVVWKIGCIGACHVNKWIINRR